MDMIERVARELRSIMIKSGGGGRGDEKDGWRAFAEDARQILTVLREPTVAMIKAGEAWQNHCSDVDSLFSEMVKAAIWPEQHGLDCGG